MNNQNQWEAVIGLEIHVQLSTNSKLFSGASTNFGALPNTQACNVDLAMPGVLPVLNEEVERIISILTHLKAIKLVRWMTL
jgi:aspartyl-tRNA(Asn)/glutamyl-tRNA(Gln) amidotransferase subunit B